MVCWVFEELMGGVYEMYLICVLDDMDGMCKVLDNLFQQEMLLEYLQMLLIVVLDLYGMYESFGYYMNVCLCVFFDSFGFFYEFKLVIEFYKFGVFDVMFLKVVEKYEDIMKVMFLMLGEECQVIYLFFLLIYLEIGYVFYVLMKFVDVKVGMIIFEDEIGQEFIVLVIGGNVKLQWKLDFGMCWVVLGVDFEMFGKDYQVNVLIYLCIF